MKYSRFEDLPVWQAAVDLAVDVFAVVDDKCFSWRGDLRNQLQCASLSISNNIAEGFERGTTAELLAFLYIARGSAGETRSALRVTSRMAWASHLQERLSHLTAVAEGVSRQLRGWADSLQNSDITGQRHLNDQTRREYQAKGRTEGFLRKLEGIRRGRAGSDAPPEEPPESRV